jgi:hypothetical protein
MEPARTLGPRARQIIGATVIATAALGVGTLVALGITPGFL